MRLRNSNWSKVAIAVAVASLVLLAGDQALASNMGFKINTVIQPLSNPSPGGDNRVALPYRNPYPKVIDVCNALGLNATSGKVVQIDAVTGTPSSDNCNAAGGGFTLALRVGIRVTNPTLAGGILVGSHVGNPPGDITIRVKANPPQKGVNDFPLPYHTMNTTAENVCTDLGLPALTNIKRIDARPAPLGGTSSHDCGAFGPFNLVLGEAVSITLPTGAPEKIVAAGHPNHH